MLGHAITTKTLFSRTTKVATEIDASIEQVWQVLVDLESYASWNPTIIKLSGKAEVGGSISLVSTLSPDKIFKLRVKNVTSNQLMVWGNPFGLRTFKLEQPEGKTTTIFSMEETIKGPLLPLFVKFIPSFNENFEQFAVALKNRCES